MIYRLNENNQITKFSNTLVEYACCKYLPDNSLIIPVGPNRTHDEFEILINGRPEISYLLFENFGNPIDTVMQVRYLEQLALSKPFYILSGLFTYYKNPTPDPRIKFFPFWILWTSDPHSVFANFDQHKFSNLPKKYKVSCLNGTPWNHRKLVYLHLAHTDYFNDIIYSFKHRPNTIDAMNDLVLTNVEIDGLMHLPSTVNFIDNDEIVGIDVTINHSAYLETYINLVTETNIRASTPMLSEKSFKPIVAGQLFILVAAQGAVQFMRDIGLDTFDDIIDHTYDTITDNRLRIQAALAQVDYLMTLDLDQLYIKIQPRLLRNSEYFRSIEFRNQFLVNFSY